MMKLPWLQPGLLKIDALSPVGGEIVAPQIVLVVVGGPPILVWSGIDSVDRC